MRVASSHLPRSDKYGDHSDRKNGGYRYLGEQPSLGMGPALWGTVLDSNNSSISLMCHLLLDEL
jgi:hypothetical protein